MPAIFEYQHQVRSEEIDDLKHVNNLVYLEWFVRAACAHSAALGWPEEAYIKNESGWVVRRHEIDYLAPAFDQEAIVVRTWISSIARTSCVRQYKTIRQKDNRVLAKGATVWVWINYKSGRPEKIPEEILKVFPVASNQN